MTSLLVINVKICQKAKSEDELSSMRRPQTLHGAFALQMIILFTSVIRYCRIVYHFISPLSRIKAILHKDRAVLP